MVMMAPTTFTNNSTRWFATTSSRRRTTSTKREDQRGERKRARGEKRRALLLESETQLTRPEHIAKFGIWDSDGAGILWLGLFPLLAMGLCLAYMPGFYDELFHEHVERNKALPTRPISLPFGGGDNKNKSQPPTDQELNDNKGGREQTSAPTNDSPEQSQAASSG